MKQISIGAGYGRTRGIPNIIWYFDLFILHLICLDLHQQLAHKTAIRCWLPTKIHGNVPSHRPVIFQPWWSCRGDRGDICGCWETFLGIPLSWWMICWWLAFCLLIVAYTSSCVIMMISQLLTNKRPTVIFHDFWLTYLLFNVYDSSMLA